MHIVQSTAPVTRSEDLARELSRLTGPCVGCRECRGLCAALIEALVLPDIILSRDPAA